MLTGCIILTSWTIFSGYTIYYELDHFILLDQFL